MSTTVFSGGSIYTMDPAQPWAAAVVVVDQTIVYVGDERGARLIAGPAADHVNLKGGMLLPGFIDAHNHLGGFGGIAKIGCNLNGITEPAAMCSAIARWAAEHPDAPVVRGSGFIPTYFGPDGPTRAMLDEVIPDRPVVIMSYDSHDSWFNTRAMELAGIDAATPDPEPGSQYFVRDAQGVPTGRAVEGASMLLLAPLGGFSLASVREAQALTLDPAPSWGLTGYMEAGIILGKSDAAEDVYLDLVERDQRGELNLRIVGTVFTRDVDDGATQLAQTLVEWNRRIRSEHLKISVQKMWADGTAFSGGALLLEPFCGCAKGSVGHMTFGPEAIEAQIEATERAGFDIHIHNDGDGSVRVILDAIERVRSRLGPSDARHVVCHNALVHPDDVVRFAQLGVIANVTPMWATNYDGTFYDTYLERLGPERMEERAYPYGDLVRSGAVVTYGADIPGIRIEETQPLMHIEAAMTRQRPGRPDDPPLVARQRIGLHDALRSYTTNAAYQLRLEDEVGSICVGKRADLVMLGADLFRTDVYEIAQVPVLLTMMDGRVTHDAR